MPGELRILLLGPPSVTIDGAPLPHVRTRKGLWLLALLALRQGRDVPRDWLAATLWPDSTDALGLYNLRRSLTDLRDALGPAAAVVSSPTPTALRLLDDPVYVDVAEFDALVSEGTPGALTTAVRLYRGPLLEGCLEEWVLAERAAREEARLLSLEKLAGHASAAGQPAQAVHYLRTLLAADRLREHSHRALMQALADCGDYAAVAQAYRDLRLALRQEINVDASPQTVALYEQLRRRGAAHRMLPPLPQTETGPPRRLPLPLTPLIGREDDLRATAGWLRTHRLVTLTGVGGIGKTRLALAVGDAMLQECPDGVWFASLAGVSDGTIVPGEVARVLGVREQEGRPVVEALVGALTGRDLLLILDNCEHLVAACAPLAEMLLGACPRLRILATSRQALGIGGEVVCRVPSLSLPPAEGRMSALNLQQSDAARLFSERALTAAPDFLLTEGNAPAVAAICRHLDGIPLAIEMAAARVKELPVATIANRLYDGVRPLLTGTRTAPPRHRTLRAVMDWSYDLLSEAERGLLCRLTVFAGGWTLEAAEQVCGEGRMPAAGRGGECAPEPAAPAALPAVIALLTSLVDKSLVVYELGRGRYHLLATVREYARGRLLEGGEEARWRERHRAYFMALAEEAAPKLEGAEQAAWFDRLEAEQENLRAALEWSLDAPCPPEESLRLSALLGTFWDVRGHLSEGREWCMRALSAVGADARTKERADALCTAAGLARRLGDLAAARALSEEAQSISRPMEYRQGVARSLMVLASVRHEQGDHASAQPLYEEALPSFRQAGDRMGTAQALLALVGFASSSEGAISLAEEALAIYREAGNRRGITNVLLRLAGLRGSETPARLLWEECLSVYRELGDPSGAAGMLRLLAMDAHIRGDYAAARAQFEECLSIRRRIGDLDEISNALLGLGALEWELGDYAAAQAFSGECLSIRRAMGDRCGLPNALKDVGRVAMAQGDFDTARAVFAECLSVSRDMGSQWAIACSLTNLGLLAHDEGDYASAREFYAEGLSAARADGDTMCIDLSLLGLGQTALDQGDYAAARTYLSECSQFDFGPWGRPIVLGMLHGLAGMAQVEGRCECAARLWGAAARLRERMPAPTPPGDPVERERIVAGTRSALGAEAFEAAWEAGRAMNPEQAVRHALAEIGTP